MAAQRVPRDTVCANQKFGAWLKDNDGPLLCANSERYRGELVASENDKHQSVSDMMQTAKMNFRHKPFIGVRSVLREKTAIHPNGTVTSRVELSPNFQFETFKQVQDMSRCLGKLASEVGFMQGDVTYMICNSSIASWFPMLQALWLVGVLPVIGNSHTGAREAGQTLADTGATSVIGDLLSVRRLANILGTIPSLRRVLLLGCTRADLAVETAKINLDFVFEKDLLTPPKDNTSPPFKGHRRAREDHCVVMYTMGATGRPKPIGLTHGQMLAAVASTGQDKDCFDGRDVYLSVMPLCGVAALVHVLWAASRGMAVGLGRQDTCAAVGHLSRGMSGRSWLQSSNKPNIKPDFAALNPTCALLPPSFLQAVRLEIWAKTASKAKFDHMRVLGTRIKCLFTTYAPLCETTYKFFAESCGLPVRRFYHTTESCGIGTLTNWADVAPASVGNPALSVGLRLLGAEGAEFEGKETGGRMSSLKATKQGEILISGFTVGKQYWAGTREEARLAAASKNGFATLGGKDTFRTGDIAEITPAGTLRIVGRATDLLTRPDGQTIALTKIEEALASEDYVEVAHVHVTKDAQVVVALVKLSHAAIMHHPAFAGKARIPFGHMCQDASLMMDLKGKFIRACVREGIPRDLCPAAYHFVHEIWTPSSGLVTPCFTVKRTAVAAHYEETLAELVREAGSGHGGLQRASAVKS